MKKLTYKIMCLDDKPETLEYILFMLDDLPFVEVVFVASNPRDALIYLKENEVDILLLDMDLGLENMDGIKFAGMLSNPPIIIACSSYRDFVFEAGDAEIIPYISKSMSFRSFEKLLRKMVEEVDKKEEEERRDITEIKLKDTRGKEITLLVKDIYYAMISNNILTVYLEKDEHEFKMSLKEFKNRLPHHSFAKPHNSILLSLEKVSVIDGKKVYLSGRRQKDYFTLTQEFNLEFKHHLKLFRQTNQQKG